MEQIMLEEQIEESQLELRSSHLEQNASIYITTPNIYPTSEEMRKLYRCQYTKQVYSMMILYLSIILGLLLTFCALLNMTTMMVNLSTAVVVTLVCCFLIGTIAKHMSVSSLSLSIYHFLKGENKKVNISFCSHFHSFFY